MPRNSCAWPACCAGACTGLATQASVTTIATTSRFRTTTANLRYSRF